MQQQATLYSSLTHKARHGIVEIDTKEAFYDFFQNDSGFGSVHWAGDAALEETLQKELSVTIRCIPMAGEKKSGTCLFTGKSSPQRVIFGKSY